MPLWTAPSNNHEPGRGRVERVKDPVGVGTWERQAERQTDRKEARGRREARKEQDARE